MAADTTEKWIRFFTKAGIPSRAAATYALTFADNRIQMDMLLDLNKEYLRDMGITLMGDVIAILRHARQVHEELAHEKLLHTSKNPVVVTYEKPLPTVKGVASALSLPPKNTKTLKATVVPAPKSASSSSLNSSSRSPSVSPPSQHSHPTKKIIDHSVREPAARSLSNSVPSSITLQSGVMEKNVPKRLAPPPETIKRKAEGTSRVKQVEEVYDDELSSSPVKKVRRVLPEHEGGYKIKMPSGTTPRSQQILAKQKELVSKKTVFDRLGQSSPAPDTLTAAVSSTTSDPVFAVTGLGSESTIKKKVSSVFSRLGDKQVSSTSTTINREEPRPVSAPSMVADSLNSPLRSELRGRLGSSTQYVKPPISTTVVGLKPKALSSDTEGILGRSGLSNKGVKSRLGEGASLSGVPEVPPLKRYTSSQLTTLSSKKIKLSTVNGSSTQPVKKVSFLTTAGFVSNKAGVFSRLGS